MSSANPGDHFFEIFSAQVNQQLVDALRAAYESACESDLLLSGRGSCEQLFGTTVYHCAKREFKKAVLTRNEIRLGSEYPLFRLAIGPYAVGFYRVGQFSTEDICKSFPRNRNGAGRMAHEQMCLPFPGQEDEHPQDLTDARNVVLAHFGNREDGLTAVYLAIPTREENGEIVQWGFTHRLWSDDRVVATSDAIKHEPHPAEAEVEPIVRRKQRKETQ